MTQTATSVPEPAAVQAAMLRNAVASRHLNGWAPGDLRQGLQEHDEALVRSVLEQPRARFSEEQLLVMSARLSLDDRQRGILEGLLACELDWSFLIASSIHHKVVQLVWRNLARCEGVNRIPEQVRRFFVFMTEANRQRNEDYFRELERMLAQLQAVGIEPLLTKGAYLIGTLYDSSSRTVNDIDLFVTKGAIRSAVEVFLKNGYAFSKTVDWHTGAVLPVTRAQELLWKMTSHNLPTLSKMAPSPLSKVYNFDLALDYFLKGDKHRMSTDALFARARAHRVGEAACKRLSPEDLLIHLCAHLYREAVFETWTSLGLDLNLVKFCDVRETLLWLKSEIDWSEFQEIVRSNGLEEPVYYALYYTQLVYDCEQTRELMRAIAVNDLSFLFGGEAGARDFFARLFADPFGRVGKSLLHEQLDRLQTAGAPGGSRKDGP